MPRYIILMIGGFEAPLRLFFHLLIYLFVSFLPVKSAAQFLIWESGSLLSASPSREPEHWAVAEVQAEKNKIWIIECPEKNLNFDLYDHNLRLYSYTGKNFIKQKLLGTPIQWGVGHLFGCQIQIWKDLGPVCFWTCGASLSRRV